VGSELPRDVPAPPGEPTLESVVSGDEPKAGFLDAALYGIAVGTVAIAVLTVANSAFLLLGQGNFRTGLIMPFNLPAALAAAFSARKRGMAGILALGFALLVFSFLLGFPDPVVSVRAGSRKVPVALDRVVSCQRYRGGGDGGHRRSLPRSMESLGEGAHRKYDKKVRVDLRPKGAFEYSRD